MAIGFVFLTSRLGCESQVEASLHDVNEVTDVYGLNGVYDFIVQLESESIDDLKNIISNRIRQIENVRSSYTLFTIDEAHA